MQGAARWFEGNIHRYSQFSYFQLENMMLYMFPNSRIKFGNVECFQERQLCKFCAMVINQGIFTFPKTIFVIYLHRIQANYCYASVKNNCTQTPFHIISLACCNLKCIGRGRGGLPIHLQKRELRWQTFLIPSMLAGQVLLSNPSPCERTTPCHPHTPQTERQSHP